MPLLLHSAASTPPPSPCPLAIDRPPPPLPSSLPSPSPPPSRRPPPSPPPPLPPSPPPSSLHSLLSLTVLSPSLSPPPPPYYCPCPVATCTFPPSPLPGHPYAVAMETVHLAPNAQVSLYPWKDTPDRIPLAVRHIRTFLRAHQPVPVAPLSPLGWRRRAAPPCPPCGSRQHKKRVRRRGSCPPEHDVVGASAPLPGEEEGTCTPLLQETAPSCTRCDTRASRVGGKPMDAPHSASRRPRCCVASARCRPRSASRSRPAPRLSRAIEIDRAMAMTLWLPEARGGAGTGEGR